MARPCSAKRGRVLGLARKQFIPRCDMSQHDLVSAQMSYVTITRHAALNCIAYMCQTICDVTSSSALGILVQCEQKGWDRGRWVGIYTQRMKQHGCVWVWLKKSLSGVIVQMVMENSHFISQGLYARSVQVKFIC